MVLRIKVDFFPDVEPPALPGEADKPARACSFCVNARNLGHERATDVLVGHFLRACQIAMVGEPPAAPKIILPNGGLPS